MKPITQPQLKMIHTLLGKQGLMKDKPNLVYGFSSGRTESSKELSLNEAKDFIQYLKDQDESTAIIKRIWHLGYLSGIIYGDTPEDRAINAAKLNLFIKQRGTVKKPIYEQSVTELKRTVRQFETIANKIEQKKYLGEYIEMAEKATKELVEIEDYEGAIHNRNCVQYAKENPVLTVKYMKQLEKSNNS